MSLHIPVSLLAGDMGPQPPAATGIARGGSLRPIADAVNTAMIGSMTRSANMRLGCSLAVLSIAVPALYVFGLGWVRTAAPIAAPLEAREISIRLEAVAFHETIGVWPIISDVDYPNAGPIRGSIRNHAGGNRETDYTIRISSQTGTTRETRCLREYQDACYFNVDLGKADLTKGVRISVTDTHDGRAIVIAAPVSFLRTSTYSFALWNTLMSV